MAETKKQPAQSEPWIKVVTRRIADAPIPGAPMVYEVLSGLCENYPQDKWELMNTHFIGMEQNIVSIMFVFVRKT